MMHKLARQIKNEDGYFLIISTMMLLALITIISVAASNTARTEVQVAGNNLTYQRNLYLAEGAAMEAVDLLENATNPRDPVEVPFLHPELKAVTDENFKDEWEEKSQPVTAGLDSSGKTSYRAGYEGTPPGYSLGVGKPKVHGFVVYGRTEKQGATTIKIGYRRAF
jgi:hypothetical protein